MKYFHEKDAKITADSRRPSKEKIHDVSNTLLYEGASVFDTLLAALKAACLGATVWLEVKQLPLSQEASLLYLVHYIYSVMLVVYLLAAMAGLDRLALTCCIVGRYVTISDKLSL